ncbi:uncharacterized protein BDZ99DRAFT_421450 [Mytilinidion resinicola]|uniref:ER-bound oxygenase mpaB/mpaB'/Rubber oxygenase catalytic domain-containing protein n=1 Tax=Mytilinidion resinicola TaxID=574789 RepID=A0A6A6YFW4_9PEZI|nr:uncharacterized protein BDZ99DRAFT_421450 [Mytilinidion resinicola]KAF2807423.1 hypothetical protein BDZ99DRAFT_421450 [Mytilinidion resinicola]
MTLSDAHAIQLSLAELEFPKVFSIAVFFALFKTYGIPTISNLLVATGQLSSPTTASKRAADTGVIITEVVLNRPDSSRTIDGIARMNYLHGRHMKAGKISNDDMLYTLSLFVLEPIRWTSRFEWRHITDLERCAMGVYWKDLGEAMNISYQSLTSSEWQDGFHWLEELETWSLRYEMQKMVPDDANARLARATFDIALFNLPKSFKPLGYKIASSLLEPRLLKAMKLGEPPALYASTLNAIVGIRKFILRHFFLPRPYSQRVKWFSQSDPHTGCSNFMRYTAHPWYIKPSLSARWGWKAWLIWLAGGVLPGDEKYFPGGYQIGTLGPTALASKGGAEMGKTREELKAKRAGCCVHR